MHAATAAAASGYEFPPSDAVSCTAQADMYKKRRRPGYSAAVNSQRWTTKATPRLLV